jgi:ABC-type dipeptide/oligopeptide/nickel transport system permease subunit
VSILQPPLEPAPDATPPAEAEQAAGQRTAGKSQGQIVRERFLHHRGAMVALALLLGIIALAFTSVGFGPLPGWWQYSYTDQAPLVNEGRPTLGLFPPSIGPHPFGQDNVGKDYFALTMRGAQQSLIIALLVGLVATAVGTVLGAVAGYFRGRIETVLMRFTDVVITIPLLAIAAALGNRFGASGIVFLGLVIGLAAWTQLARLVRGEFLVLRERDFVAAARISGASHGRIIFKHILPNAVGVIVVSATLTVAAAILLETSLSYLGVGVKSPDTSLGLLISEYQSAFTTRPWLFWWPGLFIIAIALCANFIGDGLRDAFDPRQRRMPRTRQRFGLRKAQR